MSRFNEYDDEPYPNASALWWQAQKNALRGKNGQAVLRELETALLALSSKRLIEGSLCSEGEVCAIGALALYRGIPPERMEPMDGDDAGYIAWWAKDTLGTTEALATAIQWENDEGHWPTYVMTGGPETPEQRYERVLAWVRGRIKEPA